MKTNISLAVKIEDLQDDKLYMVRDAETKFTCTNFTFNKEGQGKGQRAKWYYSTYQDYPEGVYCKTAKTVVEQLRYLESINSYLGQNKTFEIFEFDPDNIVFSTKHGWEELTVTKYNKPRYLIQDKVLMSV